MNAKTQTLILFNEKVDRLTRSELAKRMENPQYKLDYERMGKKEWISVNGVTEDAVDAFALNIRLLVQDRDGISIRKLAEDVYVDSSVPIELRDRFNGQRQEWIKHTQQPTMFKHSTEGRNYTYGELFEIIMYGGLAHLNGDKVNLFSRLTKQGAFSSFVCVSFLHTLRTFLDVVRNIRAINVDLIHHLKS